MRISVIGCGYLGAVHAAAMASFGHEVVGIDTDERKISALASGKAPFFEPGLPELLEQGVGAGRLRFSTDLSDVKEAQVHFITVGTPQAPGSQAADLRYVDAVFEGLLDVVKPGDLVVGKSTVPVGTAERWARRYAEVTQDVLVAWNPEFLREGYAVRDTIVPDRLVYGVPSGMDGEQTADILNEVYRPVIDGGTPVIITDYATAELVKVSANAFLATKISFINVMAEVAEAAGADVTQLADAIGYDARIGRRFLNAGVGFGGGCLPKDIRALQARASELGVNAAVSFLSEVDRVNLRQRDRVVGLATEVLDGELRGKRIAVLGLAFKPHSDDVRDSPALDVARRLMEGGAEVVATDPQAIENARLQLPYLGYEVDLNEALAGADLAVLLTEWPEYTRIDPVAARQTIAVPKIIDARNALDPAPWTAAGWTYRAPGHLNMRVVTPVLSPLAG
ncbi:UDP-glucose/GDP-mannose dehydrogenase family protein [Lysinibacter sp. HNR]|uniref:UDP-glucose dehydrogenase family protein n=1 Tax=Lysinibacter sp. HNR TaxID=3031408 RepID=UPI002434D3AE|nr:UDP-glucose/GDP-mannose dehydrogenase family protein [Lysinibacter sp. HNR]WGD38143.1 UDP-glucose/GDP-mannose dehydrogenase family protein [Lysinibacter sp. HNR]